MKKFILVLGLLLSSVVFADTAKCRAIIEKFLEQGTYIMVYSKKYSEDFEYDYFPKSAVLSLKCVEGEDYLRFYYITGSVSSGAYAVDEFFTLDCVTQDEKGNIIINKDY